MMGAYYMLQKPHTLHQFIPNGYLIRNSRLIQTFSYYLITYQKSTNQTTPLPEKIKNLVLQSFFHLIV